MNKLSIFLALHITWVKVGKGTLKRGQQEEIEGVLKRMNNGYERIARLHFEGLIVEINRKLDGYYEYYGITSIVDL